MGITPTPSYFTDAKCKGFHITFKNGWTVSVQFGPGNHCEHYTKGHEFSVGSSKDAELWRWDENGDSPEEPRAYCTMEEVAAYIAETALL